MFIFTFLCDASEGFMKTLKAFLNPFEVPQRSVKIEIKVNVLSLSGIGTRSVNRLKQRKLYLDRR